MITQAGREQLLADSIECFALQTHQARELVVVHDSGDEFHTYLIETASRYPNLEINIVSQPAQYTLGLLRNSAVERAKYSIICQWDDDDLYHPLRLEKQYSALLEHDADFCFLGDQLHYFYKEGFLFWDDWSSEAYPRNLIQGSILGKKSALGSYPDLPRGEDTDLVFRLAKENLRLVCLKNLAWLYIYTYHGSNAWDSNHHKAISNKKRLQKAALNEVISPLKLGLQGYAWRFRSFYLPHEQGGFTINLDSGEQSN
jgi:glycosyltransferase involved in cell wall biosynthesis